MSKRKSILRRLFESERFLLIFMLVFLVVFSMLCGYDLAKGKNGLVIWDGVWIVVYLLFIYHHFRHAFRRYDLAKDVFEKTGKLIDIIRGEIEQAEKRSLEAAQEFLKPKRVRRNRRNRKVGEV